MMLGLPLPALQLPVLPLIWILNVSQKPTWFKTGLHTIKLEDNTGTFDWWGLLEFLKPLGHALGKDCPSIAPSLQGRPFCHHSPHVIGTNFMDHNFPKTED